MFAEGGGDVYCSKYYGGCSPSLTLPLIYFSVTTLHSAEPFVSSWPHSRSTDHLLEDQFEKLGYTTEMEAMSHAPILYAGVTPIGMAGEDSRAVHGRVR